MPGTTWNWPSCCGNKSPPGSDKKEDSEEPKRSDSSTDNSQEKGKEGTDPSPSSLRPDPSKGRPEQVSPAQGDNPIPTDQQVVGRGNLPPVQDDDRLVPMSPEDTIAHLQRAAQRIRSERKVYLQNAGPTAGRMTKPW